MRCSSSLSPCFTSRAAGTRREKQRLQQSGCATSDTDASEKAGLYGSIQTGGLGYLAALPRGDVSPFGAIHIILFTSGASYLVSSAVAIAPFISGRIVDTFTARREALSTHSVAV